MVCFSLSLLNPVNAKSPHQDSFYFKPDYAGHNVSISASKSYIDEALAKAIDSVHQRGGGIITIKSGDYKVKKGVNLKSNVHIHVEPEVNFYMDEPGVIFTATSLEKGKPIENFSIIGQGNSMNRFTVHFKYGNTAEKRKRNGLIKIGYASNFKLSNINIIDAYTDLASIVVTSEIKMLDVKAPKAKKQNRRSSLISEVVGVPSRGIIEKLHNENGSYGFGLIQMQAGNNIVYRDLSGSGGVTLRLESGVNINQLFRPVGSPPVYEIDGFELPLTIDQQPKVDQVFANNLFCEDGHAAFTMSPHTIKQGAVYISKVRSNSCEAAGEVSKGFINNFAREEQAGLAVERFKIEKGDFSEDSVVLDVHAIFGQNSQVKSKNFKYIPCELRVDRGAVAENVGLDTKDSLDFESRRGPSLFPLHYSAASQAKGDGGYKIKLAENTISGSGFLQQVSAISIHDDMGECAKSDKFTTVIGASNKKGNKKNKKKSH